jgi:outer membrane receptor protein involved in Fe transport
VQVYVANPFGFQAFANEGEAEVKGFELSSTWQATDNLQLQATFGYNDTEFKTGGVTHDPGDPMDYVPEKTWSASADYRVPLWGDAKGHLRLDYQHMDERPYILRNFGYPNPVTYFDPVDNINARVGVDFGRWTAELFVENIANDHAEVLKPVATQSEGIVQKPRAIGLTMRTSF